MMPYRIQGRPYTHRLVRIPLGDRGEGQGKAEAETRVMPPQAKDAK